MTPIAPHEELNFEEWLAHSNYPDWRKKEIQDARDRVYIPEEKDMHGIYVNAEVKYFVKEEWYPEYKHFRGIWARSDEFKAICGPFFHRIESSLFKHKHFIKKIPKDQRADYLQRLIERQGYKYQTTDFTAYESHFKTLLMDNCEFELYRFMSSQNAEAQRVCRMLFDVVAGDNYVVNKFFTLLVEAKRMSGEMNTSLGNGFSNLMFLLFAFEEYRIDFTGPGVEGDDGIAGISKDIPASYFIDMGLNVKMETHEFLSDASFCGLVFDPIELINIRDPRTPLGTIMWVPKKYALASFKTHKSLLKSKALSIIFEYPGCPILSVLGHKLFSLLEDVPMKDISDSSYTRREFAVHMERYLKGEVPIKEIGQRTRALMERLFDVSVQQQLDIEESIRNMTLQEWDTSAVQNIMPQLWKENYNLYTRTSSYFKVNDVNYLYGECPSVNKHLSKLYTITKVKAIRRFYGKRLTFKHFISNSSVFNNMTIQDKVTRYKLYLKHYYERYACLHVNMLPLYSGQYKY